MDRIRGNHPHRAVLAVRVRRIFMLALLAFAASACGEPAKGPEAARTDVDWRTFEGTLNATGHRQAIHLGPDRFGAIFSLSGSLLLVGERRLGQGFQYKILGFTDNATGLGGWSSWTDTRGDQVFSEIKGDPIGNRRRISGTILGGTGRYAGITGEYEFTWQLVIGDASAEDGSFQGRSDDIRGRFRRIAPEDGKFRP